MKKRYVLLAFLLLAPSLAQGHKPYFSEGQYSTPRSAYPIENIDHSIVLYHRVRCNSQQLWLSFSLQKASNLFVQLGVPVLDRLKSYRPNLAIVAPGLPPALRPGARPSRGSAPSLTRSSRAAPRARAAVVAQAGPESGGAVSRNGRAWACIAVAISARLSLNACLANSS